MLEGYQEGLVSWPQVVKGLQDAEVADVLYDLWLDRRNLLVKHLSFEKFMSLPLEVRGDSIPLSVARRDPVQVARLFLAGKCNLHHKVIVEGLGQIPNRVQLLRERLTQPEGPEFPKIPENLKELLFRWYQAFDKAPKETWIDNLSPPAKEHLFRLMFKDKNALCLHNDLPVDKAKELLGELLPQVLDWEPAEAIDFVMNLFWHFSKIIPDNFDAVVEQLRPSFQKFVDKDPSMLVYPLSSLDSTVSQFWEHLHRWLPLDVEVPWSPFMDSLGIPRFTLQSNYKLTGHPPAEYQIGSKQQQRRSKKRLNSKSKHLAIYPWMYLDLLQGHKAKTGREVDEETLVQHLENMVEISKKPGPGCLELVDHEEEHAYLLYRHLKFEATGPFSEFFEGTKNKWILEQDVAFWVRKFPTPRVAALLSKLSKVRSDFANLLRESFWPSYENTTDFLFPLPLALADIDVPITKLPCLIREPSQMTDLWIESMVQIHLDPNLSKTTFLGTLLDEPRFKRLLSERFDPQECSSHLLPWIWKLEPRSWTWEDMEGLEDNEKLAFSCWLPTRDPRTMEYFSRATQVHNDDLRAWACECMASGAMQGEERDRLRVAKLIARRVSRQSNEIAKRMLACISMLGVWSGEVEEALVKDLKTRSDPRTIYLTLSPPAESSLWALWSQREIMAPVPPSPGLLTGLSLEMTKLVTGEPIEWPQGTLKCAILNGSLCKVNGTRYKLEAGVVTDTENNVSAPLLELPQKITKLQEYFDELSPLERALAYPKVRGLVEMQYEFNDTFLVVWKGSVVSAFPASNFEEYARWLTINPDPTKNLAFARVYLDNIDESDPLQGTAVFLREFAEKELDWSRFYRVWAKLGNVKIVQEAMKGFSTWRDTKRFRLGKPGKHKVRGSPGHRGKRIREERWPIVLRDLAIMLLETKSDKVTVEVGHRALRTIPWVERLPILERLASKNPQLRFTSMFHRLPFDEILVKERAEPRGWPFVSKGSGERIFMPLDPSVTLLLEMLETGNRTKAIKRLRGKLPNEKILELMDTYPDHVAELATLFTDMDYLLSQDFLASEVSNELNQILEAMPASRNLSSKVLAAFLSHGNSKCVKTSAQKAMVRFLCRSQETVESLSAVWALDLHRDVRTLLVEYDLVRGGTWLLGSTEIYEPECYAPLLCVSSRVFVSSRLYALCHNRRVPKLDLFRVVSRVEGELGAILKLLYATTLEDKWTALLSLEGIPSSVYADQARVKLLDPALLPRLLSEEPPKILTRRYLLLEAEGEVELDWESLPERSRQLAILRCQATCPQVLEAREMYTVGTGVLRKSQIHPREFDLSRVPFHAISRVQQVQVETEAERFVMYLRFGQEPDILATHHKDPYIQADRNIKSTEIVETPILEPWTISWPLLEHLCGVLRLDLRGATIEQTISCLNGLTSTKFPVQVSESFQAAACRLRGLSCDFVGSVGVQDYDTVFYRGLVPRKYPDVDLAHLVAASMDAWIGVEGLPDTFSHLGCATWVGAKTRPQQISLFRRGLLTTSMAAQQGSLDPEVYGSGRFELSVQQAIESGGDSWNYVPTHVLAYYFFSTPFSTVKTLSPEVFARVINYRLVKIKDYYAIEMVKWFKDQPLTPTGRANLVNALRSVKGLEAWELAEEIAGDLPQSRNLSGSEEELRLAFPRVSRDMQAMILWRYPDLLNQEKEPTTKRQRRETIEIPEDLDMCLHGGLSTVDKLPPFARDRETVLE